MASGYRTLLEHHKETTSGTGAWNSFCTITKDRQRYKGTVNWVKIKFILDDIAATSGTDDIRDTFPFGVMFAASRSSSLHSVDGEGSQLNPNYILDVTAKPGGGGVAYLNLRGATIEDTDEDLSRGDGPITLWMKDTDLTIDDTLIWRMFIEVNGRWLSVAGL